MNVTGENIPSAASENYEAATWFPGGRKFCGLRYLKPDRISLNIKAPGMSHRQGMHGGARAGQGHTSFSSSFSTEMFLYTSKTCISYLLHICISVALKEITDTMDVVPGTF